MATNVQGETQVPRKQKRNRGGQPGEKALKLVEILVLDADGEEAFVYEREFKQKVPASQVHRKQVAYELSSGERVQLVDEDTFLLTSTGERFVRVTR
jgi:hypothetical protein